MGNDLAHRQIEIYRLGGALPELIGTFVVGIPKRAIEDFRAKNRYFSDDTVFRTLISAGEHQKMREWLKVPLEGGNIEQTFRLRATLKRLENLHSKAEMEESSGFKRKPSDQPENR